MKAIELATSTMILIIIGIIILSIGIYIIGRSKGTLEVTVSQQDLRNCCTVWAAQGKPTSPAGLMQIKCAVKAQGTTQYPDMKTLADQLGISDISSFCLGG